MHARQLCLASILAASSILSAADGKLHFGLQIGASFSGSDLKSETGSGAAPAFGLNLRYQISGGHLLGLQVDRIQFSDHTQEHADPFGYRYIHTFGFHRSGLGLDYMYFPSGQPTGFYVDIGASYQKWAIHETDTVIGFVGSGLPYGVTYQTDTSSSPSTTAPALALGYMWTFHVGTELRYSQSNLSGSAPLKTQLFTLAFQYTF
jgi:hypothetical protein